MTALQILVGLTIGSIEKIHDYVQIIFSDGTTLTIFNNFVFDFGRRSVIEGVEIKSVDESATALTIFFESEASLSIGLNADDYNGPEAMVLRREDTPAVVWN